MSIRADLSRGGLSPLSWLLLATSCVLDVSDVPVEDPSGATADVGGSDAAVEVDAGPAACAAGRVEYLRNQVPPMTGPTTPSGRVERSSTIDAEQEAWQAFDDSVTTLWISEPFDSPTWLAYTFSDGPRAIDAYAITYGNGKLTSRAPRDWTLEALEGERWVVLDQRSGEVAWDWGVERREYAVANPGAHSTYRLHVTDDNDDRAGVVALSIGSLELMTRSCE